VLTVAAATGAIEVAVAAAPNRTHVVKLFSAIGAKKERKAFNTT